MHRSRQHPSELRRNAFSVLILSVKPDSVQFQKKSCLASSRCTEGRIFVKAAKIQEVCTEHL